VFKKQWVINCALTPTEICLFILGGGGSPFPNVFFSDKFELCHKVEELMTCDHRNVYLAPFPGREVGLHVLAQFQVNSILHPWNCPVVLAICEYTFHFLSLKLLHGVTGTKGLWRSDLR